MSKSLFRNSYRKPETQIVIPDRVALRAATKYKVDGDCWVSTYSVASHGYAQIGWQEKGKLRGTTAHRAASDVEVVEVYGLGTFKKPEVDA